MTSYEREILSRVDKIDKSKWANKSVSLIKSIGTKWHPDAPYSIHTPTDDKYIHLLDLYLAIADPTEYKFGKRVFGDYRIWDNLKNTALGKKEFPRYQEELALKLKSEALRGVIELAEDEETKETTKLQAYKFIIAGQWGEAPKKKVDKQEQKSKIRRQVASDIERIGLKVIK